MVQLGQAFYSTLTVYSISTGNPSARGRFTSPSLLRTVNAGDGILTVSSIGIGDSLSLRSRLTLIRLALIRKPWSFGVGVSRPHYRYLYLHLLFRALHTTSQS